MRHLSDGVLRRLIDEPLAVSGEQAAHLASCERCAQRSAAVGVLSTEVGGWLAVAPAGLDAAAALASLRPRLAQPRRNAVRTRLAAMLGWVQPQGGTSRLARPAFAAVAAAGMAGVLVVSGAAAGLLTIFQPTQVAALPVTTADMAALDQLSNYGTWSWTSAPTLHSVAGPAEAAAATGLVAPSMTLPAGTPTSFSIRVMDRASGTFTFNTARAQAAAQAAGKTLPPVPANLDGSSLYVTAGPAQVIYYGTVSETAAPALVVAEGRPPVVTSTGVDASVLQEYLLSMPGISLQLAADIRALKDPSHVLPIPVPVGQATWQTVDIGGRPGVLVGDNTGLGSFVIWQGGGVVYAVGGQLSADQVLSAARSLR